MNNKHIVITGTGRSGTTFLVQLFTNLGLETGYDKGDLYNKNYYQGARAGLEHDIRGENIPYIVKDPSFCDYVDDILINNIIDIECVIIPIRDLYAAAESRRLVVREGVSRLSLLQKIRHIIKPIHFHGGLWDSDLHSLDKQESNLAKKLYHVILMLSDHMIPIIFIRYPKMLKDSEYLYTKLQDVITDHTYSDFLSSYNETVRPELIHTFNNNDK